MEDALWDDLVLAVPVVPVVPGKSSKTVQTPEFWHWVEQNVEAPMDTEFLPVVSLYKRAKFNMKMHMQAKWNNTDSPVANLLPCCLKLISSWYREWRLTMFQMVSCSKRVVAAALQVRCLGCRR